MQTSWPLAESMQAPCTCCCSAGVAAIQRGFPRTLVPSHTSREISVLPTLPAKVREAFAVIARRTEHAVFQQRPLGQADWEVCRATYAGLLSAAGGGGLS